MMCAKPLRFRAVVNGFGTEVIAGVGPEVGGAGIEVDWCFFSRWIWLFCCNWGVLVPVVGPVIVIIFFGIIFFFAVVTPAVTVVDIAHAHPAELRATSAFHVVAAKHPLDSMAAFRALFVAPAF
jgi:hypothetical protein